MQKVQIQKRRNIMDCRPEYDIQVIGQNLRRLRETNHLTVEDVREYLCLGSVQAVYKYERGKGYPQADTMFALMELYGAGLEDIVRKPEETKKATLVRLNERQRKQADLSKSA